MDNPKCTDCGVETVMFMDHLSGRYYLCPDCPGKPMVEETKKTESGLEPPELKISEHLIEAWNGFVALQKYHDDDNSEFRFHIHALQNILMARVTTREYPEYWFKK